MIVAVTGGAGFLGSHLVRRLVERDDIKRILVIDNLFTGRYENLAGLNGRGSRVEVIRHDICDPFHFECDLIVHLACPAAPIHYARNPARTIITGVVGTLNTLKCAREVGARMVFASTSEVYGDAEVHPQPETYRGNVSCNGPRSNYDESKRAAEALCVAFNKQWGTDVRVIRFFNVYGPYMALGDGRVVPEFFRAAMSGEQIPIHGDGSQTRSFCYVDDAIDATMRLCFREAWPGADFPVNVGNPQEITVGDLASQIIDVVRARYGIDATVRAGAAQIVGDDPHRRCPDIARAREHLGWEPITPLRVGLERTADYFWSLLHGTESKRANGTPTPADHIYAGAALS